MILVIGNDHKGYSLKHDIVRIIEEWGIKVLDKGCNSEESVDYPQFAHQICGAIICGEADMGILICGTGIGMSMAANRFPGIRAAVCCDVSSARMCRRHNNANVICLPGDLQTLNLASILHVWLNEKFEGGRHERRIFGIDGISLLKGD